jgi:hypothetical protein
VGTLADNLVKSKRPVVLSVAQKHGVPNFTCADTSDVDACGAVVADGVTYRFASLHFHTPAENTVDGVAYPMEMHLVHLADDGSVGDRPTGQSSLLVHCLNSTWLACCCISH